MDDRLRREEEVESWYSAFSRPPPMSSSLATVNVVTFFPEARLRISGSRAAARASTSVLAEAVCANGRSADFVRRRAALPWLRCLVSVHRGTACLSGNDDAQRPDPDEEDKERNDGEEDRCQAQHGDDHARRA